MKSLKCSKETKKKTSVILAHQNGDKTTLKSLMSYSITFMWSELFVLPYFSIINQINSYSVLQWY